MQSGLAMQWDQEYQRKNIPSSFKEQPSDSVQWLASHIENNTLLEHGAKILDIGCGKGRNSLFLAQQGFNVTGFDFSAEAIQAATLKAENNPSVTFIQQSAGYEFPVPYKSQDLALDVFVSFRFTKEEMKSFVPKLVDSLKPQGYYLNASSSVLDDYYNSCDVITDHGDSKIVHDQQNNFFARLHTPDSLKEEFSKYFNLVTIRRDHKEWPMNGKPYLRDSFWSLWRLKA